MGEQQIAVFCNLDGEKHTVKADGAWRGDPVLLENYEARQMDPEGGNIYNGTLRVYGSWKGIKAGGNEP